MKLVIIDSQQVDSKPEKYNSCFHTSEEAPDFQIPVEAPCSYARWLPLISLSRNIPSSVIQKISLSPSQGRLLLAASKSSLHTRVPNRMYAEELEELITPTLSTLIFPPEGLFMRLDACSPKDGEGGTTPLHTTDSILLRLTTSYRAMSAITRLLGRDAAGVDLFFLPHDNTMSTALEYRVFCAPPDGVITAVSQYRWHKPSIFHDQSADKLREVTGRIMAEIVRVHGEILREVKNGKGAEMDELLLKQGFSFDVMFDERKKRCCLIEFNIFGVRSGCGSCLFHWLEDQDVLYGKPSQSQGEEGSKTVLDVEFRISI